MSITKSWILYVLIAFGSSTWLNFGVFAEDQPPSLHSRDFFEKTEHVLQRRGGQKRTQKGSPKLGNPLSPNTPRSGGRGRAGASASGSQSTPDSLEPGGRINPEAAKSEVQNRLIPAPPPRAPFTPPQDTASSSQPLRAKQRKGQGTATSAEYSPKAPSTPTLRGPTSSRSSGREQTGSQAQSSNIDPSQRASLASSSQPSRERQTRSQRRATKAKKNDPMSDAQAEIARLRVTQDSGATRAPLAAESIVRPPSAGIPRRLQQPTQRHIAPEASEIQQKWGSTPIPDEPSGLRPVVTHNVPAAQGIHWLGEQSRIARDWKKRADAQRGNPPPQNGIIKEILADGMQKVQKDRGMAQVMRKLDDANFEAARIAMSNGLTSDDPVQITVQASKDAARKAQAFTYAVSHSEGSMARALAKHNQWEEATKHLNREHRAFARQELRMQRGQTFDYHYINRGVKEGLAKLSAKNQTPGTNTLVKAVGIRKTYKDAAVGYRKAYKDYYTVRDAFSGSSSDESETSLFDDVLPPGSPRSGSPKPKSPTAGSQRSESPRAGSIDEESPRRGGARSGSARSGNSGSLYISDID